MTLHRSGITQRAIARKLGVSRNTVKKYVDNPKPLSDRQRAPQRSSKLDRFKDNILAWLEEDMN